MIVYAGLSLSGIEYKRAEHAPPLHKYIWSSVDMGMKGKRQLDNGVLLHFTGTASLGVNLTYM